MTTEQKEFIKEHYVDLVKITKGLPPTKEVNDWLIKNYPRECWKCNKRITNVLNILKNYANSK